MKVGRETAVVDHGHVVVIYATNMVPASLAPILWWDREREIREAAETYELRRKAMAAQFGELDP